MYAVYISKGEINSPFFLFWLGKSCGKDKIVVDKGLCFVDKYLADVDKCFVCVDNAGRETVGCSYKLHFNCLFKCTLYGVATADAWKGLWISRRSLIVVEIIEENHYNVNIENRFILPPFFFLQLLILGVLLENQRYLSEKTSSTQ